MDHWITDLPAEIAGPLQLGLVLGESLAFTLVSGRCSAAQAEALLRLREEKHYKYCAPSWKSFCARFLKMSGTQADRIIRLWQEFGPGIFELREILRVSVATYRAIEPLIRDGALHFNDEAIELDPANAQKIVAAVAELKHSLRPAEKPAPDLEQRLNRLERSFSNVFDECLSLVKMRGEGPHWARFEAMLDRAASVIRDLDAAPPLPVQD